MERSYINKLYDLQEWFFAKDCSVVAFDTETTSLDYATLQIQGISFCDGQRVMYCDLDVAEHNEMVQFLQYQFRKKIKKLIGHNIAFDLMVLWKLGVREVTENVYDTQTAFHLLDETGETGLKHLAIYELGVSPDLVKDWDEVKDLDHHSEEFYCYGANDAEWTWMLFKKSLPQLQTESLTFLMFKIEMPFVFVLRDLSINGILVDLKKVKEIDTKVEPIQDEAEKACMKLAELEYDSGDECFWKDTYPAKSPINWNSNKQVVPLLMDKFGIELTELTKTGEKRQRDGLPVGDDYYKLDKVVLAGADVEKEVGGLAADYPICLEILKFRMAKSLRSGFTSAIPEHISPDGRVRCSFNNCVAATGRLSSSNPNLQNLRKMSKILGVEVRSCFVAPKGKSFIVADYGGQELRILAYVTQDPTLLDAFTKGLDLHLVTANLLFNLGLNEQQLTDGTPEHDEASKLHKDARHKGKNGFNFPVVYGSTEHGISRGIGVSLDEAKRLLEQFLHQYPGISDGIADCKSRIKNYGFVRNSAGRKRRFAAFTARALRQAFNFLIQGYAADMLRLGMVAVRKVCLENPEWELKIVLTVHDEVVLEVKDEYVDVAAEAVKQAMIGAVDLGIPVLCDVGSGKTYAEAK
jgi:DNA polymerase-1